LLYDFDYEIDRISLVQSLLLMTYWYETPDDQKDTWHWMGVAISLSHTIGLHRDPKNSNMDTKRKHLWKRIWWSCFMRDRLVALGMRRPTRIKDEDYEMPMLEMEDFELDPLPDDVTCLPADCTSIRDPEQQRQLAVMCIQKAKLCFTISHVLQTQYSVLNNDHGAQGPDGSTRTTMMLLPRKSKSEPCEVEQCDTELSEWILGLPECAVYRTPESAEASAGSECLILNRALLLMVYYTALSALHRPQVLPSGPQAWPLRDQAPSEASSLQETSRKKVRQAASEITRIAQELSTFDMVRFLPTTGVTVLLPAVIIHLLDIKSHQEDVRNASLAGFCQCMHVMQKLRDIYSAADYATQFLEAAIRKAGIQAPLKSYTEKRRNLSVVVPARTMQPDSTLTPPPDSDLIDASANVGAAAIAGTVNDTNIAQKLNTFLASSPPDSDSHTLTTLNTDPLSMTSTDPTATSRGDSLAKIIGMEDLDDSFENLIDFGEDGGFVAFEEGGMQLQGESSGFMVDMDWMKDGALGKEFGWGSAGLDWRLDDEVLNV
jgi:hypothetical protein